MIKRAKMIRSYFLALSTVVLITSCSHDNEMLQVTKNDNGGVKAVSITAVLPENMMTRAVAADDAAVSRCYMQVLAADGSELGDGHSAVKSMTAAENGYTATVYLKEDESYTFLFWADNATSNVTDLKNVPYANGTTIAWAGKMADQSWSESGITCNLEHAVAHITVHTTTAVTLTDANGFTVNVPTVYSAYNVYEEKPVSSATVENGYTYTDTNSAATDDADLCHFYVLVDGYNQILTMQYNGVLGNPAVQVTDVPLKANCHTTLSGDVCHLGLVSGTITATMQNDWGNDSKDF